jgi:NADH-quinone oxidoreductase subunit J
VSLLLLAPHVSTQVPLSAEFPLARIVFLVIAAFTLLGAVSTIVQKNDVGAVMSLVATFFGLAAIYTFLSAHFIAALQVLVYAGAIMVLFIFVVMVLNRDETDPWVWRGLVGKIVLGLGPMLYLCFKLSKYLHLYRTPHPNTPPDDFGTVAQVGELLFTDYLFAFEAVSVLLLIAVIAAVVVARTSKHADKVHDVTPPPNERWGDASTGKLYNETALQTPPSGGHH